jgi:CRISPR system Cascade subunit CasE
MYLTRLTLNPRDRNARRDLANPYELHSTCERTFPTGRVLWRLEVTRQGLPTVLVQHASEPDWAALAETYLAREPEMKTLNLQHLLEPERLLRFRLRANPTVTRFDPNANKNKRHGLTRLEDQLDWLEHQFMRSGLEPVGFTVSHAERITARKRNANHPIIVYAVTFDGHARVQNPDAAHATLELGLGHGKALGLGLLSVAPAR